MIDRLGAQADLTVENLTIRVQVVDQQLADSLYLVVPIEGSGEQWVTGPRLDWDVN